MTQSKHTPAPWRASKGRYGYQIHSGEKPSSLNHWIANLKCESCPASEEANAQLIAAAPELLEALETIICSDNARLCQSEWEAGRAAIAKAKGE